MVSPTDEEILIHLLTVGNDSPRGIANETDTSREYVSERLAKLEDDGLVESFGHGPWALTIAGVRTAQAAYRRRNG